MAKKLSDINWNQVYYFYEVARRLSMKEASEVMGVSTPTVSEHIKKLETHLDIKLFDRHTRRIELTNEGRHLFNQAKEMFDTGVRFLDAVSPRLIGGYPAKIGIMETLNVQLPVDFVFRFMKNFSEFGSVNTLRENSHDRLENRILRGDLDWGISMDKPKLTSLNYRLIGHSEIVFAVSHRVFSRYNNKVELLCRHPMLRSSWDEKLNQLIEEHLQSHAIKSEEHFESDHPLFCQKLVRQGICVAPFSKDSMKSLSWAHELRSFTVGKPLTLPFYALWPKGNSKMITVKKLVASFNDTK